MKLEIINNIRVITPDDGMWITNGDTFSDKVYLGVNADINEWSEITDEEKVRLEAMQNEDAPTDDLSELEQKAHAYDILTGVIE